MDSASAVAEPARPSFVFDSTERRVTDTDSGLSVRWLSDDPPLERRRYFELVYAGSAVRFEASYNHDDAAKRAAFPHLNAMELFRATRDWPQKMNYRAIETALFQIEGLDCQRFVEVWQHLLSELHPGWTVTTRLSSFVEHVLKAEWNYPHG